MPRAVAKVSPYRTLRKKAPRDDYGFPIPVFRNKKELEAWYEALPTVDLTFDERLKPVKTSIRLTQRTIEGFNTLARQKGLLSGQTLMKLVLDSYLQRHLPDFPKSKSS